MARSAATAEGVRGYREGLASGMVVETPIPHKIMGGSYRLFEGGRPMRAMRKFLCGVLVLIVVAITGCTSDSPVAPQGGTITVNPEPNSVNAPWQMTGPNGFTMSAAGDTVLADVTAGSYTLIWGAAPDWTTPIPAAVTLVLVTSGTLMFTGTYVENGEVPAVFVSISGGTFMMGSPTTEPGRSADETQHQVTLTRGFSMQTTEVTNQQYRDMVQWAYDNGYVTATSTSVRDASGRLNFRNC
jgi:hypothetical protein